MRLRQPVTRADLASGSTHDDQHREYDQHNYERSHTKLALETTARIELDGHMRRPRRASIVIDTHWHISRRGWHVVPHSCVRTAIWSIDNLDQQPSLGGPLLLSSLYGRTFFCPRPRSLCSNRGRQSMGYNETKTLGGRKWISHPKVAWVIVSCRVMSPCPERESTSMFNVCRQRGDYSKRRQGN